MKEITNKEIDKFIQHMSSVGMDQFKANPLTLYVSTFIDKDGLKKGCVFTSRPDKDILKFHTFVTDKDGNAVDKVSDFIKRNKVADYKLIQ